MAYEFCFSRFDTTTLISLSINPIASTTRDRKLETTLKKWTQLNSRNFVLKYGFTKSFSIPIKINVDGDSHGTIFHKLICLVQSDNCPIIAISQVPNWHIWQNSNAYFWSRSQPSINRQFFVKKKHGIYTLTLTTDPKVNPQLTDKFCKKKHRIYLISIALRTN